VRGRKLPVLREGNPLPPLIGGRLAGILGDSREDPRIRGGSGEGRATIVGDALQNIVVTGTGSFYARVEVVPGGGIEAGGHAAVRLVGVHIDVGAKGNHYLGRVGWIDST